MSTKDPSHPDSASKPFPTTRRSLQPPPPSTGAPVTPRPPSGPPSSRRPALSTSTTGPLWPSGGPAVLPAPPPQARLHHDAPPSSRSPSLPPPSSIPSPSTPTPSKSTLPASVQKALVTLDKVKTKLDAIERQKSEPIAIIGMACRFPGGATTPEAFFRLLESGADTITRVSPERWTDYRDEALLSPRWGAFLQDDVSMFDAPFFGISPREAERLDPQQRLLLELTWEALERGGQVPSGLVGSRTGVFVGLMATDYMLLNMQTPPETWDLYSATGTAHCFPAGRIAYAFGFQGPTMVVDTACSSSLVAVHLAIQSLRSGETDMAVAAGMNLMLSPDMFEMTAKTNALSPDGRCKTFDARADGYVRGEGGGVVILKRLSEAQRDGDPILALLRGSAVNQDGRSTGLTTPNVLSQQAMLEQALASGRVAGSDVGYVETHGTGTSLGDPIEFEALRAVLGQPREDGSTCVLGAVKTNIGHLEAAAGIAGLIKAVMVLQREVIPKNLHLRALNPRMSLDGTPFVLPVENRAWERGEKPRIAGVSSFGLSGTNAHVLVEEAPPELVDVSQKGVLPVSILPISARTPESLVDLARAYSDSLALPDGDSLVDIGYTASQRRAHHEHRLVAVGQSRREISDSLAAFVREGSAAGVVRGRARATGRQRVVFVFPGQGGQWVGMGRQLFREEEAFRASIELCHEAIRRHGTFSLIDEIQADEGSSRLGEIDVVQPMIFAIQVSLAALWQAWGVEPDYVIGHSMGEVAAARAAGYLSVEDAAKIICRRSRLLVRIAGQGAMAHVELSAREAEEAIAGHAGAVAVAVKNGPRSTVISGDPQAVDAVLADLERKGVFCRRVKVDVASHSPQVDILMEDLAAVLFNLRPRAGRVQMISTVTGEAIKGPELMAEYWVKNLRDPVLFAPVVQRLSEDRPAIFVEIGPHPVLTAAIEENLRETKHEGTAVGSMRRSYDERRALLEAVGALHVRGASVDWKRVSTTKGGRCVSLPAYAWQRRRYWVLDGQVEDRSSRRGPITSRMRNDWLFTPQWHRADHGPAAREETLAPGAGPWLILSDRGGVGEAVSIRLRDRGIQCVRAIAGQKTSRIEPGLWELDPLDPTGYASLLRDALPGEARWHGIVHLMATDHVGAASAEQIERAQVSGVESVLLLAQALLRDDRAPLPRLWLVTRGAAPVVAGQPTSVAQAPLWGFGRTLQGEHPDLTTKLLDLPRLPWAGESDALLAELFHEDSEDQIALRGEDRFVARLTRSGAPAGAPATVLRSDGTYLLTGGLGGLGISFAEWMVGRGARHLVLVGRSSPGPAAAEAIARMEAAGAKIIVASADVGVRTEVEVLIDRMTRELPPLRGVVHAAAVLDDHTVLKLSVTSMRDIAAAKMYGAWHLHQKTRGTPLDFFVLFSSAASLLGSMGQGNYAAANAFLDALAHQRRAEGLPAIAIDWGPFAEVGLAAAQSNRGERLSENGFHNMSPPQGHEVLSLLLGGSPPQVGVLQIDIERAMQAIPRLTTAPFFSALAEVKGSANEAAPVSRLVDALRRTPAGERRSALTRMVREELGKILRLDPLHIDPAEPFAAHGFDSLMALELRNRLQTGFGVHLSMADVVTNTRVEALTALLEERLRFDAQTMPPARPTSIAPGGTWVVTPRPSAKARARLFCFPYAGGAAPVFSAWPQELPPEIEVCAIQAPGRHERLHEPALTSVAQMVESLVPALLPYLDKPFAAFGHCLGAIVMFEALRVLAKDHDKRPIMAFASAAPAPHRYIVPALSALTQDQFSDVLRSIGFADESLLADADAQAHMMPAVRADFDAAARYAFTKGAPLDVPMMAFAGLEDGFAPIDLVGEWDRETTGRFSKVAFPGGHYFIVPERGQVLAHVREEVLARLAAMEQEAVSTRAPRGPWTLAMTPRTSPVARVICVPGVGQSNLDYARWVAMLGEDIEVHMAELPGHGTRVTELPLARVTELAQHLAQALPALSDRPFALFGADLGALIAFEATRALRRAGQRLPAQLVVSSAMAPDIHYFAAIHHHAEGRFLAELKRFGISSHAVPERALRADCAALSSYAFTEEPPLDVPITAFGGEQDHFVPIAGVRGWGRHTTAELTFEARPGGHHLSDDDEARLAGVLHQRLSPR